MCGELGVFTLLDDGQLITLLLKYFGDSWDFSLELSTPVLIQGSSQSLKEVGGGGFLGQNLFDVVSLIFFWLEPCDPNSVVHTHDMCDLMFSDHSGSQE